MSLDGELRKLERVISRLLGQAERGIARDYARLLRELRGHLAGVYAKYGDQDGLSYAEMAKYDRLRKLEKELSEMVRRGMTPVARQIRDGLRDSMVTAFDRTKGALEAEISRTLRGVIKPETIQASLQNPVSGLTLNRRLQVRRDDIITRIQQTVTQGLVRGESYRDMAARLKDELEADVVKAYRIVRTEGHRVQEAGKKESLDNAAKQGVVMNKTWRSSKDERVRASHQKMDGQTVPYDQDFENPDTGGKGPHPGAMGTAEDDINCRCIFTVEVVRVK